MMAGLTKVINFDVKKPKFSYKDLKAMNETDKDEIMNMIMARDKKM